MPSFSDITDVSTIDHSFKTDRSRTPLFQVAQYGDDIIGRKLNLKNCPGGSGSRTHNLPNSASTETATAAYIKVVGQSKEDPVYTKF